MKDYRRTENSSHQKKSAVYVLDAITIQQLSANKRKMEAYIKYNWSYYSEFAYQRSLVSERLHQALSQTSISHEFENWQRAMPYKYALTPLSILGSLNFIGGRFNMGKNLNTALPIFGGRYIAENKDTALQEHLGQEPIPENSELTPRELALINPASEAIVSLNGKLDKVFDLTNLENMKPFVEIIKTFRIPDVLKKQARKIGAETPRIIKTPQELYDSLTQSHWRQFPTLFDVPSASQIFGHLIYSAGIEGILYRSKFTKELCLVVFPKNFVGTDSYIQLADESPHKDMHIRLDATHWQQSETIFVT